MFFSAAMKFNGTSSAITSQTDDTEGMTLNLKNEIEIDNNMYINFISILCICIRWHNISMIFYFILSTHCDWPQSIIHTLQAQYWRLTS